MSRVIWDLDRSVPCKNCGHPIAELLKDQWQHMPYPDSRSWPYGWYTCRNGDPRTTAEPRWLATFVMRLMGVSTLLRRVPERPRHVDRWRSSSPPRRPQRPWRRA